MINTDPALILNRSAPDPLSPAMSITVDTPCPRCGATSLRSLANLLINRNDVVLTHCEFYAIGGDDTWINAKVCEEGDPMPFLRTRAEAMRKRTISV